MKKLFNIITALMLIMCWLIISDINSTINPFAWRLGDQVIYVLMMILIYLVDRNQDKDPPANYHLN